MFYFSLFVCFAPKKKEGFKLYWKFLLTVLLLLYFLLANKLLFAFEFFRIHLIFFFHVTKQQKVNEKPIKLYPTISHANLFHNMYYVLFLYVAQCFHYIFNRIQKKRCVLYFNRHSIYGNFECN